MLYAYFRTGFDYHSSNQLDSARQYYRLQIRTAGNRPVKTTSYAYYNLGMLESDEQKAAAYFSQAYAVKLNFYSETDINLADDLEKTIKKYRSLNQSDSVIKYSKKVLRVYLANNNSNENIEHAADKAFRIAYEYHDNITDSAIVYYRLHIALAEKLPDGVHPQTDYACFNLGNLYYSAKAYRPAVTVLQKALQIRKTKSGVKPAEMAAIHKILGFSFHGMVIRLQY